MTGAKGRGKGLKRINPSVNRRHFKGFPAASHLLDLFAASLRRGLGCGLGGPRSRNTLTPSLTSPRGFLATPLQPDYNQPSRPTLPVAFPACR
jgi:hypothetical protein